MTKPAADPHFLSRLQAAWNLFEQGLYADAERLCQELGKQATLAVRLPSNLKAELTHLQGTLALRDGNTALACQLLSVACELRKTKPNPICMANYGLALHESGQLEQAERQYRAALSIAPKYINAWYNLHALVLGRGKPTEAIKCLQNILRINPIDADARFMQGLILDHAGDASAASFFEESQLSPISRPLLAARLEAWQYLKHKTGGKIAMTGSLWQTFALAFAQTSLPENLAGDALVLEFGVRHGNSIRQLAKLAQQTVHGFDSFAGLPEAWHQEPAGSYSTQGQLPAVPANVTLHQGWFEDTLPAFLAEHPGVVRLLNVDCDLYSATSTVLHGLAERIVPGSILLFDEHIGNLHWRQDEFKAFQEAVAKYGWRYEYLACSFFTKQVAVKIC